ncbi:hypothetical protein ACFL9T_09505 [Thermodesulfobacteriota bacterium]
MNEAKKKAIDKALEKAGLNKGRVVIGLYEAGHEQRVGVYFHYKLTDDLANALIQLALQDPTVYEGLKDLRQRFDLIVTAIEGAKPAKDDKSIH